MCISCIGCISCLVFFKHVFRKSFLLCHRFFKKILKTTEIIFYLKEFVRVFFKKSVNFILIIDIVIHYVQRIIIKKVFIKKLSKNILF